MGVLEGDHLVHVPMSLRTRTSAVDLWLLLKRSGKVYQDLLIRYSGIERATSVCGVLRSSCSSILL